MGSIPVQPSKAISISEYLIGGILLCYPMAFYIVRGGMNVAMFLLTLISLYLLFVGYRNKSPFSRAEISFGVAMSLGLVAILISQLYHHNLLARHFDSAARFLLVVPIFYAMQFMDARKISAVLEIAFPLGAISALAALLANSTPMELEISTSYMNHIHLGDTSILLAVISLLSIDWFRKDRPLIKSIKLCGFIAGISVSVISGARGGWFALPIFIAALVQLKFKTGLMRKLALGIMIFALLSVLGYMFVGQIQDRIWMIYSDLSLYASGSNLDTSIGVRLQLWNAALHLIMDNPVVGVGADGFGGAMRQLSDSGAITPIAAELGRGEVHNEILAQAVRYGLLGLIFILSIYFVPFYLFMERVRSDERLQAVAALMGICVSLGFFVFGLTVEIFNLKMTAAFYCTTVAVLLAVARSRSM